MQYKGQSLPEDAPIMGIRQQRNGRFVAFRREPDGEMFSGDPRETRDEAIADIEYVISVFGPARVYL